MSNPDRHVIHVGSMQVRERRAPGTGAKPGSRQQREQEKGGLTLPERLLRDCALCTAAVLAVMSFANVGGPAADGVMSRVASAVQMDFQPDEALGRLQFVQNLLPESVLVFWNVGEETAAYEIPKGDVVHTWSEQEPWLEVACEGDVKAAAAGEVMSVTRGDEGLYTMRLQHADGSETIYGNLAQCLAWEGDYVEEEGVLGTAGGELSFEIRREGRMLNPADVAKR